jgi:hypothetical protein
MHTRQMHYTFLITCPKLLHRLQILVTGSGCELCAERRMQAALVRQHLPASVQKHFSCQTTSYVT